MLVIVGLVIVMGSVLAGYIEAGGHLLVLLQIAEFIIIGGSAIGALIISTPPKLLSKIVKKSIGSLKGNKIDKNAYIDLLKMLFELGSFMRKNGLIALEPHVENSENSTIFSKYPLFLDDPDIRAFITDTLRLVIMGAASPHEIEMLMDADIELHHHEGTKPGMILQKIADSLPGLGIVAAVLGIIVTMQAIDGPAAEVGRKVAAALVGTFLGVLLSYGFVQPLATNIDLSNDDRSGIYNVIKLGITCTAKGYNPVVATEFARRSISSDFRPSFQEVEQCLKEARHEG
jgi:chemotaxis protein MotA